MRWVLEWAREEGLEWMEKRIFSEGTNWARPTHWQDKL